jgi:hypothetical protein
MHVRLLPRPPLENAPLEPAAEEVYRRESGMREELRRRVPVKEAYAKYGWL